MAHGTDKTHFGYEQVAFAEKQTKVDQVFNSVARRYDLMNDAMSFGLHRLWKKIAIQYGDLSREHTVLDLASGTGDLAIEIAKCMSGGSITLVDINSHMLEIGRSKLLDQGLHRSITYILANAEKLPLDANEFDRIFIAFGLRNVTHIEIALQEMYRVLMPGGKLVILEFSKLQYPLLNKIYDAYSFNVLPMLGKILLKDAASYQYLAESIRMHPDQATLGTMLESVGFSQCSYQNLHGGLCAIHYGYKF